MTEQPVETWHPEKSVIGGVAYLSVRTGEQLEPLQRLPEWMIDRIIADHELARKVRHDD